MGKEYVLYSPHAADIDFYGVGLPAGFDPSRGEGMGLNLVRSLAAQINGSFRMESGAAGTRCIVEFAAAAPVVG